MPDLSEAPMSSTASVAADGAPPGSTAQASRRGLAAGVGAVGAAFLASLCCIGPLVFALFGVGAGLASTFEPLRPVFTALTVGLLGLGFYVVHGRQPAMGGRGESCAADGVCVTPRRRQRDSVVLWTAAVIALVFLTFPQWSKWLV